MSNRLFQGIIHQMHSAIDRVIGVINDNGTVVACSEHSLIGEARARAKEEMAYTTDVAVVEGYTYQHIGNGASPEFMVFVEGEDKAAEKYAAILAISLSNALTSEPERTFSLSPCATCLFLFTLLSFSANCSTISCLLAVTTFLTS